MGFGPAQGGGPSGSLAGGRVSLSCSLSLCFQLGMGSASLPWDPQRNLDSRVNFWELIQAHQGLCASFCLTDRG